MATDLQAMLEQLAALPTTDHPFISVYLDWIPAGTGQRQALRILEQELNRIAGQIAEHGPDRESFSADRQRIMDYVLNDAPDDARSLAIFACHALGVWEALALQAPVENTIAVDRFPHLFPLAQILDDYETYAVVLAEGQEARLFVVALNTPQQAAETAAEEEVNRVQVGGWSQARYQRHTDHVIKAHTKEIADKLGRIVKRYQVQHVIIAGNDAIKGMVLDSLPEPIKEKLVEYVHLDVTENIQAVMEELEPLMDRVERAQEAAAVAELEDQAYSQGLGVVGRADTALALSRGQVRTLLVLRSFRGVGGECPGCGMLRASQRDRCPYDGAELRSIDLREAFTLRALQQGAEVQVVEASDYLARHEGVGALLRYREAAPARNAQRTGQTA